MGILNPVKTALGAKIQNFKSVQYEKIIELVSACNKSLIGLVARPVQSINAINATATATAEQIATGLITSTSAAATAITFPSAASVLAKLPATVGRGTTLELVVDNSLGANTVTMTPSASITAATAVITGGATLTVASGATGIFKIYFVSATAAKIYRIG